MSVCFPKLKSSGANVKVEIDFSNYAKRADLKNATKAVTSYFTKQTNLAHLNLIQINLRCWKI